MIFCIFGFCAINIVILDFLGCKRVRKKITNAVEDLRIGIEATIRAAVSSALHCSGQEVGCTFQTFHRTRPRWGL